MLQEHSDVFPERERELVATSLIGVEQLTETVHEFLDLTRIEAGELRLDLEPVDVAAVLADALRRVDGQAKAQDISLSASNDATCRGSWPTRSACGRSSTTSSRTRSSTRRMADASPSRVIASRLPKPERATHSRSASLTPARAFPPAFRPRIFDKFFRLEHHQTEGRAGARGAGIGLYMCRQIVELHGGEIACGSGLEACGTCITVTLPVHTRAPVPVRDRQIIHHGR